MSIIGLPIVYFGKDIYNYYKQHSVYATASAPREDYVSAFLVDIYVNSGFFFRIISSVKSQVGRMNDAAGKVGTFLEALACAKAGIIKMKRYADKGGKRILELLYYHFL
jgi:hypothetical protein